MTTRFQFTPGLTAPYQFQPVLDQAVYTANVPSLLFGNRFYLDLKAADGTQIWYGAVVGSPDAVQLEALSWDQYSGLVTAQTSAPHGYAIASSVSLVVSGCVPAAYNGAAPAFFTTPDQFTYPLAADPGAATAFGSAGQEVNLIGGVPNENGVYFTSRLVFRTSTQQFEASP